MSPPMDFDARKRSFLERLTREAAHGRVDWDLVEFLQQVNGHEHIYTTSSCSGRIALAEAHSLSYSKGPGRFRFVAKWHRPVTRSEVARAASGLRNVWLLVRGPILHFVARDEEWAAAIIRAARDSGFKRTCVVSRGRHGTVIEVVGDDRLDMPLVLDGEEVAALGTAVDVANEVLLYAKLRLARLIGCIDAVLHGASTCLDPHTFRKTYIRGGYRGFRMTILSPKDR